jgi:cell fate (sporulation/competence/biofilm development) regulator YlbF (YheA/YmcA/DUF963 family)
MADLEVSELEIAPPSVIKQAARDFARALAATPQFRALEAADEEMRTNQTAQQVIGAYQSKQQSMRMSMMLKTASAKDRAELERLQQAFQNDPTVAAYLTAQAGVTALCQAAADQLSRHIGLSFTAACGPGCC